MSNPSLYRLFRHGRYGGRRHGLIERDLGKNARLLEQRERFGIRVQT